MTDWGIVFISVERLTSRQGIAHGGDEYQTAVRRALGLMGVVAVLAGCGSTTTKPTLSQHDKAALVAVGKLTGRFRSLEHAIASDTIAGSKVTSRAEYVQRDGPRIAKINRTAQRIRLAVGSFENVTIAKLYDPLSEALSREAGDMALFLNSLKAGDVGAAKQAYSRIGTDEERVNNVAIEQLPKVRAYARSLND